MTQRIVLTQAVCLSCANQDIAHLPADLLADIDRSGHVRSAFLERAARGYLDQLRRKASDARDANILETQSAYLNSEARDVLEYR